VLNNPLKYTDPSGEKAEGGGILAFFAAAVISVFRAIFGSNDTGYSNPNVSNTPIATDFSLGSNNSTEVAAMADVPPEEGTGYRLEEPKITSRTITVLDIADYFGGIKDSFNQGMHDWMINTAIFVKYQMLNVKYWYNKVALTIEDIKNERSFIFGSASPEFAAEVINNISSMTVNDWAYAAGYNSPSFVIASAAGAVVSGVSAEFNAARSVSANTEISTTTRLQTYVTRAANEVDALGDAAFTPKQFQAIERNPNLRPMFRGNRIDVMARRLIEKDANLSHLQSNYTRGPDFVNPKNGQWWDMTTPNAWNEHVKRYGKRGILLPTQ
jgi:hypothetical protein